MMLEKMRVIAWRVDDPRGVRPLILGLLAAYEANEGQVLCT